MRVGKFAAIAGGLVVGGSLAYSVLGNSAASLHIDEPTLDLGFVEMGSEISGQAHLSNAGGAPLSIHHLTRSCNCFNAQLDKAMLQPGESTVLRITVKGNGRAESNVKVSLESNDRAASTRVIDIIYRDAQKAILNPTRFDFGRIEKKDLPSSVKMLLTINDEVLAGQIDGLSAKFKDGDDVRVFVRRTDDNQNYRLQAFLSSRAWCGEIISSVRVFDSQGVFEKTVPLYAYIPSRVFNRVAPVILRYKPGDPSVTGEIDLTLRTQALTASLVDVTVSPSLFGIVTATPSSDKGKILSVHVRALSNQKPLLLSELMGYVRIRAKVSDNQDEIVQVPVTVVQRDLPAS